MTTLGLLDREPEVRMGRRSLRLLAALALLLPGCAATFWAGDRATTLGLGMSQAQAQQLLGPPRQVMRQQMQDMLVETWKYADQALVFQNGVLKEIRRYKAAPIPEIPGVD